MRKLIYGAAVSMDLYLAGPNEEMDWLRWSDEAARISAESFEGADTMLIGRKSFEYAVRTHGGLPSQPGIRTILFSRSMGDAPAGLELVREDVAAFTARLKAEPGGNILVMGGGEIGAALIAARLVDEIGFNIHPLLLGGGVPALPPTGRRLELELIEARPLPQACVLVRHRVIARK
jgi:dihydrofolate reductase